MVTKQLIDFPLTVADEIDLSDWAVNNGKAP